MRSHFGPAPAKAATILSNTPRWSPLCHATPKRLPKCSPSFGKNRFKHWQQLVHSSAAECRPYQNGMGRIRRIRIKMANETHHFAGSAQARPPQGGRRRQAQGSLKRHLAAAFNRAKHHFPNSELDQSYG